MEKVLLTSIFFSYVFICLQNECFLEYWNLLVCAPVRPFCPSLYKMSVVLCHEALLQFHCYCFEPCRYKYIDHVLKLCKTQFSRLFSLRIKDYLLLNLEILCKIDCFCQIAGTGINSHLFSNSRLPFQRLSPSFEPCLIGNLQMPELVSLVNSQKDI